MKLIIAVALFCCASAARQSNHYKTKRIIKVRVPPRQYHDFYAGPKGFLRPSGPPIRFKEYHNKHLEHVRPNHPPFFNSYNNIYVKHQTRPPPSQAVAGPSFSSTGFSQSFKGFSKEVYQKFPLTYGSGFPHKASFSSFKFPTGKEEFHITHNQVSTSAAPVHVESSSSSSLYSSSESASSVPTSSVYQPTSYYLSSPHAHVQSSNDNSGPIKEIPAPDLGPKSTDPLQLEAYATYGKGPSIDVTNLVSDNGGQQLTFPTEYFSAFDHQANNLDLINDNHLSTPTVYTPGLYRENFITSTVDESAHESEAPAATPASDVVYKSSQVAVTPVPSPSYEVTEEQHTAPGDSSPVNAQYYYAPDPDPSQPVHKVPSTKELFNEQKPAETYIPGAQQNFQILEGGTVAAPLTTLSTQELFSLMHGFPGKIPVVAEPVVAIVGHQPGGLYVQPNYQYIQTGQSSAGHYQQGQTTQPLVIQQPQYESYAAYAQPTQSSTIQNYHSEDNNNYQYEPEASESRKRGNVMKMDEDSPNDVQETEASQNNRIIIHFNKLPEVPFYTTLPNKQAAEALASLQAAGSIGSNYVDRNKIAEEELQKNAAFDNVFAKLRGDQGPEKEDLEQQQQKQEETEDQGATDIFDQPKNNVESSLRIHFDQEVDQEKPEDSLPAVEVQKSIPIFETTYSATSLLDNDGIAQKGASMIKTESFGKRIKPK